MFLLATTRIYLNDEKVNNVFAKKCDRVLGSCAGQIVIGWNNGIISLEYIGELLRSYLKSVYASACFG